MSENRSGDKHPNWQGGWRTKIKCLDCGKQLKNYYAKYCHLHAAKGERGNNWQGGKTKEQDIIRKSVPYLNWRISVFKRDNYTCRMPNCGQRGGYLEANHIKRFAEYPELRLEISNGITLCKKHHRLIRGKENEYEGIFTGIINEQYPIQTI